MAFKLFLIFLTCIFTLTLTQESHAISCQGLLKGKISQESLADLASKAEPEIIEAFVKDMPIFAYRIPRSIDDVPAFIKDKLGEVDQATYTQEYFDKLQGGVVILQLNGDQTDFYPIRAETFNENYTLVGVEEVSTKNQKLTDGFSKVSEMETIVNGDPNFIGVLKTKAVNMIRMSMLGFDIDSEVTIESPWGGDQVKPIGSDAYLVFGDEHYLINLDPDGLPIGYLPSASQ